MIVVLPVPLSPLMDLFDSSKFKRRFPDFQITTYRQGLETLYREWKAPLTVKKDK